LSKKFNSVAFDQELARKLGSS